MIIAHAGRRCDSFQGVARGDSLGDREHSVRAALRGTRSGRRLGAPSVERLEHSAASADPVRTFFHAERRCTERRAPGCGLTTEYNATRRILYRFGKLPHRYAGRCPFWHVSLVPWPTRCRSRDTTVRDGVAPTMGVAGPVAFCTRRGETPRPRRRRLARLSITTPRSRSDRCRLTPRWRPRLVRL